MNNKSAYNQHTGINTNANKKIAIIYSLDYLFVYIIEIKDGKNSYYICSSNNEPIQFGNLADARKAALKEKAEQAYLALSKTDEENDLSTCHANHQNHFDYTPLTLCPSK
ncbi:MAG TPA: hypothetical protein VHA13_02205 [Gammaproteobacteria bacterium]|nr:hypothetical protein [Gammaproteobacteria bacterium]